MRNPGIRPCTECGTMTRSGRTAPEEAPGTIKRGNTDLCIRCWTRAHAQEKPAPAPNTKWIPCIRCGVLKSDGGHWQPLCADCRSVLTKREREMWAA